MKSIIAANPFIKFKKQSPPRLQLEIDSQVRKIAENPKIGELKTGDLKGVSVLKFKFNNQLYLLSYQVKDDVLYLYTMGSHENFYKRLKMYLES